MNLEYDCHESMAEDVTVAEKEKIEGVNFTHEKIKIPRECIKSRIGDSGVATLLIKDWELIGRHVWEMIEDIKHLPIYDIHEPIPTEALGTCNIDSASSSPSVASNLTINTSASRVLSQQQPQSGPTLASGQNNCPGPVGHGSNVSVNNFEIPPAPTKAEVVLLRPHQATAWATAKSYAIVVLNMGSSIKVLHDWYDILTLPPMMSSDAISLAV
ncbi:hypothetical protein QAD02_007731 [Eretmocerus hayati]|uniref:Uncharacterized protein n=1 Tax=Eretmocerus hayati TaxID=131215 RepID=A0ACC2N4E1_9HYME|nr:hypothetical protein QAD02_007731 [Eretmocerus hayati]